MTFSIRDLFALVFLFALGMLAWRSWQEARRAKAHQAEVERRGDRGVDDGRVSRIAKEAAEPPDALAAHHMIGVDQLLEVRHCRYVSADNNCGAR